MPAGSCCSEQNSVARLSTSVYQAVDTPEILIVVIPDSQYKARPEMHRRDAGTSPHSPVLGEGSAGIIRGRRLDRISIIIDHESVTPIEAGWARKEDVQIN